MELSGLLSHEQSEIPCGTVSHNDPESQLHSCQHSAGQIMSDFDTSKHSERLKTPPTPYELQITTAATPESAMRSPYGSPTPKSVAFELLFPDSPQYRARLPMRVQIFPHDTTESIVTTVKNFYGLYAGPGGAKGVSFEDHQGNTLIARYENLRNNMIVYVRVIDETPLGSGGYEPPSYHSASPVAQLGYSPEEPFQMQPPQPVQALNYVQSPSRPDSQASHKRSLSPTGRGRRSASASTNPPPYKKPRSRSGYKSRGSSTHGSFADIYSDGMAGYSSGDGAPGSVSSKTKSDHLGNTEISLDNIVEGGRRKRAKFESSELPLFAPPQMPAANSNSSVSPARRIEHQRASLAFTHPSQHPFAHPQVFQSPKNYGNTFGQPGMYATPVTEGRRTRGTGLYTSSRPSIGVPINNTSGILPTPDPTVGSNVSEEDKDVALQLMRLGEMSNISHGRTSASTLDDTFSGRADAASSTGATSEEESESEEDLPPARRQKREASTEIPLSSDKTIGTDLDEPEHAITDQNVDEVEYEDGHDGEIQLEFSNDMEQVTKPKNVKGGIVVQGPGRPRNSSVGTKFSKTSKPTKVQKSMQAPKGKNKVSGTPGVRPPISPTSLSSQSRKASVASALYFELQLGEAEEDLSSKPRCQRCRKSKKGCDRQRPCQRCKDAGLSADQCISEDEGNGRKGRYGRHMGVSVKKDDIPTTTGFYQAEQITTVTSNSEKSKKRKR